ncbi:hypothetical protein [Sphingorhabdus sp.]|jgi:hypothetical protein|uniref:hypothetical protein n=1 Tax=Sphingorhabdus sp. TaxID=1902408 RepID=UPI002CC3D0D5|nr:hypothetical protein [Sphingorhabdus sp.]HQS11759.1 hypothetical protein [Sphingorhabdus sp.]
MSAAQPADAPLNAVNFAVGHGRWGTLVAGIATTILLYLVTIVIAARFGVRL